MDGIYFFVIILRKEKEALRIILNPDMGRVIGSLLVIILGVVSSHIIKGYFVTVHERA